MSISSIKAKIFRKFFQKELEDEVSEIRRTAFKHARADLEEAMVETTEDRVNEFADKKLNDMLSVVDMRQVVTLDKQRGIVFVGGERADEITLSNLKSEAEFLEKSSIWRIMYETPKELAQRAMFVSGESLADLQKGKSMLYTLAAQKNIIDTFKSYVLKK